MIINLETAPDYTELLKPRKVVREVQEVVVREDDDRKNNMLDLYFNGPDKPADYLAQGLTSIQEPSPNAKVKILMVS